MKKILLIQIMLLSSLIAEQGHEQGVAKDKKTACEIARKQARATYNVFQMNSDCRCNKTQNEEWTCELLFSYMSKK